MQCAQLNTDGSYSHQITTGGNVEWDENHFCPASALTAEEAAMFHVVTLLETEQPAFDTITQSCQRNGGELVNGQWQYKWDVGALDAATAAANQAQKVIQANQAIKAQLDDLDLKSIRALREGDLTRIKALEDQAGVLRAQITA
jgi:hypothetical protein